MFKLKKDKFVQFFYAWLLLHFSGSLWLYLHPSDFALMEPAVSYQDSNTEAIHTVLIGWYRKGLQHTTSEDPTLLHINQSLLMPRSVSS